MYDDLEVKNMDLSYGIVYRGKKNSKVKFRIFLGVVFILVSSLFVSNLHDMSRKLDTSSNKIIETSLQKVSGPSFPLRTIKELNEISITVPNIQNEFNVTIPKFKTIKELYIPFPNIKNSKVLESDDNNHHVLSSAPYVKTPARILPASTTKVAYLTFDDGPSKKISPRVLELLKEENIKANFFVIGELSKYHPEIVKMERDQGHTVCNHTYSHDYKKLYASPLVFLADINKCDQVLKNILGDSYSCKYVRFPGGGYGKKYTPFKELIVKENYINVYWDVESGDAEGQNVSVEKQLATIKSEVEQKYISKKAEIVILMHDSFNKETTLQALPEIIKYLRGKGYAFKTYDGTISN